ncbi:MAG TPA: ORF6N domain-containing protein, partial [Polyangiaceae bacterium]
ERGILSVRNHRVMLDADLAALYGVEKRALVQAVKRNIVRFPADFMLQLTVPEAKALKSQSVISKPGRGGNRHLPCAFTEQDALEAKYDAKFRVVFDAIRELMAPPTGPKPPLGFAR